MKKPKLKKSRLSIKIDLDPACECDAQILSKIGELLPRFEAVGLDVADVIWAMLHSIDGQLDGPFQETIDHLREGHAALVGFLLNLPRNVVLYRDRLDRLSLSLAPVWARSGGFSSWWHDAVIKHRPGQCTRKSLLNCLTV